MPWLQLIPEVKLGNIEIQSTKKHFSFHLGEMLFCTLFL